MAEMFAKSWPTKGSSHSSATKSITLTRAHYMALDKVFPHVKSSNAVKLLMEGNKNKQYVKAVKKINDENSKTE